MAMSWLGAYPNDEHPNGGTQMASAIYAAPRITDLFLSHFIDDQLLAMQR